MMPHEDVPPVSEITLSVRPTRPPHADAMAWPVSVVWRA